MTIIIQKSNIPLVALEKFFAFWGYVLRGDGNGNYETKEMTSLEVETAE